MKIFPNETRDELPRAHKLFHIVNVMISNKLQLFALFNHRATTEWAEILTSVSRLQNKGSCKDRKFVMVSFLCLLHSK